MDRLALIKKIAEQQREEKQFQESIAKLDVKNRLIL